MKKVMNVIPVFEVCVLYLFDIFTDIAKLTNMHWICIFVSYLELHFWRSVKLCSLHTWYCMLMKKKTHVLPQFGN